MVSRRLMVKTVVIPGQIMLALIILLGADDLRTGMAADKTPLLAGVSDSGPVAADSSVTSRPLNDIFASRINIESIKAEAVDIALHTVKEMPGDVSFALLGNVYENYGNSAGALECWRRSLELNPKNATALNSMACVAMKKAEYDKAVELWRQAIQINPELPDVHLALAGALICLGKSQEAIESLKRDIEANPRPGLSYAMLGNQYLLLGQYDKAKAAFTSALPYAYSRSNAYYGLATVHTRLGETDKSREYSDIFRKLKSAEMEALKKRDRDFDDLDSVCEHVAQTHSENAIVYLQHNRFEEAEQLLQRAARLDANNVLGRRILASLYQQTGRLAEALEIHEKLSGIEPKNTVHYFNMGICAAMLGQFDKAEQSFRKTIEITPKQAKGYREVARIYLMFGCKHSEALRLAQKAADLEENADTFYVLSWAYEVNGDIEGSLRTILRAMELAPDNTDYKRTYEKLKKQEGQNDR